MNRSAPAGATDTASTQRVERVAAHLRFPQPLRTSTSKRTQTVRIVIAEQLPLFADGLRRLLGDVDGFTIVGVAATIAAAEQLVRDLSPDLLLVDLTMSTGSGLDVLRALRGSDAHVRAVLIAEDVTGSQMVEAVQLGARGLILRTSSTALLVRCLRSVMAGEYWFGQDRLPDLVHDVLSHLHLRAATPAERLTPREVTVMTAVAEGATNRDISQRLGLSEQTVKNHLSHIYDKVGVSNRVELTLFVLQHKLTNGETSLPALT